jgi:hypothetical protein
MVGHSFGIVSWNARGLLHNDPILRRSKFKELALLCRTHSIVAIQECHGDTGLLLLHGHGLLRSHVMISSHPVDEHGECKRDSGGVAYLLDKGLYFEGDDGSLQPMSSFSNAPNFPHQSWFREVVPGRVLVANVWDRAGAKELKSWNCHNYGLTSGTMRAVEDSFKIDIKEVKAAPLSKSLVLCGDLNIHPEGEPIIKIERPIFEGEHVQGAAPSAQVPGPGVNSGAKRKSSGPKTAPEIGATPRISNAPFATRWGGLLDTLTEIRFAQPNHFYSATNTLNKLTRIFVSVGRSALPLLRHQAGVVNDPMHYDTNRLSDHAPTFWRFSNLSKGRGTNARPIKHAWCTHPAFKERFELLCEVGELDSLPMNERSVLLKEFIRDAARHARDVLFETLPNSPACTLLRLSSIARAVWSSNIKLYGLLVQHSELARFHLCISGGIPSLSDANAFEEAFREAKLNSFQERVAIIRAEHTSGETIGNEFDASRRSARLSTLKAQEDLWLPTRACLSVMGVRISSAEFAELDLSGTEREKCDTNSCVGFVTSADNDIFYKVFSNIWGKVFGHNDTDMELTGKLLEEYLVCKQWSWDRLLHPSLEIVRYILSKLKSTAPGEDGISNMAWKHGGEHAARYIMALLDAFCEGSEVPDDINVGLMVFLKKGEDNPLNAVAPEIVFVHPTETRPLTLKQGDNKHVAATLNFCISPAVVDGAIDTQRGFIYERQLAQNIVDLDFYGRKHAFQFRSEYDSREAGLIVIPTLGVAAALPLLVLYDFASAFPSVAHAWLFAVLRAIRLWSAYLKAIRRLYTGNKAYASKGGILVFMFPILSGILQGCPLSGTLFVFVIDPLLWMFRCHLNKAIIRACADDVGAALRRLSDLATLHKLFSEFRSVSLLTLKPTKCVIIMTVCDLSDGNLELIRQWLAVHIPDWKHMKIQGSAKYLGMHLGPEAGAVQWDKPIEKFNGRVSEINSTSGPISFAIRQFNCKAVPVLGYKAQMVSPPTKIIRTELSAILTALKLAGNSMTADCAYDLQDWLGLDPIRPSLYMVASMLRAAFKTLVDYVPMHNELRSLAVDCFVLAKAFTTIIPPGWDSNAFCSNLFEASQFHSKFISVGARAPLRRVLLEWRNGKGGKSLQKGFYNCLRTQFVDGWCGLISDKINDVVIGDGGSFVFDPQHKHGFLTVLKKVPASIKTSFFKTIINSWATSHRYHEHVLLPCIFGCVGEKDDLQHYLRCDPMWTCAVTASSLPHDFLALSPMQRLCIVSHDVNGLRLLGVVYRGYHALRLGHRYLIDKCVASGDFTEILLLFTHLCGDAWRHITGETHISRQRPTPVAKAKTKVRARAKAHSHTQSTRNNARPAADAPDVYSWWIA